MCISSDLKYFHTSDLELAAAHTVSQTLIQFSLTTCSVLHFFSTTRCVEVSGVQRMMGTHGPMVTVVAVSLHSALLQLKKRLTERPIV